MIPVHITGTTMVTGTVPHSRCGALLFMPVNRIE